jgi:hypothetical protein
MNCLQLNQVLERERAEHHLILKRIRGNAGSGLLDPFEELRAQAYASGFVEIVSFLNVGLRRFAEPNLDHGCRRDRGGGRGTAAATKVANAEAAAAAKVAARVEAAARADCTP